jgi:multiple sugar transport system substrate-binding protein
MLRRLSLLLISIVLILSACGPANLTGLDATIQASGQSQPEASPPPVETAASSAAPIGDPVPTPTSLPAPSPMPGLAVDLNRLAGLKIEIWHPWSGEAAQTMAELVELFNLSNELGIQVELRAPGSLEELDSQVGEALAVGTGPDLVAAYLFQALEWEALGPLVDLAPYIEDPRWGLDEAERNDFYPVFWQAGQAGERQLALPALGSGQALVYNQSWAEALGFSQPPETPQQLIDQVCAAARANQQDGDPDNDGTGGLLLSTHYSPMLGWLGGFGAAVYDPSVRSGSPYAFESQAVVEAFTFLRSLYDQGCAWLPEAPYPEQAFAGRRALLAATSLANLPLQTQAMARAGNSDRWMVLPFPSPDGQPVIDAYGPGFEIFASTPEEQLAAWILARWLVSPERHARLVEAAHGLPVRKGALAYLQEYQAGQPKWAAAQMYTVLGRAEPVERSWKTVRWALSDAASQLFRSYFTLDQAPSLAKFLDQTADELHANPP